MKRPDLLIAIFGSTVAVFLWWLLLVFAQPLFLQNFVSPAAGMDIQIWLEEYQRSQILSVAAAWLFGLTWHLIAFLSSGKHSDHRIVWVFLQVACVAVSLGLCAWLLPDTEQGSSWAYLLAFLNGFAPFWFGTVWCTPGACKYAPMGAGSMRGLFGQ